MLQEEKDLLYQEIAYNILAAVDGRNNNEKFALIAKILNLSEKAVYNKFTGRSRLVIDEIVILASKLKLSLDLLMLGKSVDKSYIPFHSDGLMFKPREFGEYIVNINKYFSRISHLSNVHGYFLANEVLLFHLLGFQQIMYLKLYIWNKINWKIEGIKPEYNPSYVTNNPPFLQEANLLKSRFYSFDSTEIWNPSMLDNLISHFNFLWQSGDIADPNIKVLFKKELFSLVDYLENLCITGQKPANMKGETHKANINLSQINFGAETIIVKSDEVKFFFQQADVPNYMRTIDNAFIDSQLQYYHTSAQMSDSITGTGEMKRKQLFALLRSKCEVV